jgi:hypothetical protein
LGERQDGGVGHGQHSSAVVSLVLSEVLWTPYGQNLNKIYRIYGYITCY